MNSTEKKDKEGDIINEKDDVENKPVENGNDDGDDVDSDEQVKERIQKEKEKLREQRRMEEEERKQAEKERFLKLQPTKHKEKAGGGEPKDEKTKERRETVKKVENYFSCDTV